MPEIKVRQGTPEWLQERVGKCSASRVKDALSILKRGGPSIARKKYAVELVSERMRGFAVDHFVTPAMDWGLENERYAAEAYEIVTGAELDKCGLFSHPTIDNFVASPDRLLGDLGLCEIKCPTSETHIEWMFDDVVPEDHKPQMIAQLSCTGRKYVDFVSFDPRLPARHQIFIKRLEHDEAQIAALEFGVIEFLAEVDAMVERLNGINPLQEQLRKSIALEDIAIKEDREAGGAEDDPFITDDDINWIKGVQEANR